MLINGLFDYGDLRSKPAGTFAFIVNIRFLSLNIRFTFNNSLSQGIFAFSLDIKLEE
jgi:hypothetical protein